MLLSMATMKPEIGISARNPFRIGTATTFHCVVVLWMLVLLPVDAFYSRAPQPAIPVRTSSLLAGKDPEETPQTPPLRRYQGGMMAPVVISATPEEENAVPAPSNFMRVNGQDTSPHPQNDAHRFESHTAERTMSRPYVMFRPSVVGTNPAATTKNRVSFPLLEDSSTTATQTPSARKDEEEAQIERANVKDETPPDAPVMFQKVLTEKREVEAAVELNHFEIEPQLGRPQEITQTDTHTIPQEDSEGNTPETTNKADHEITNLPKEETKQDEKQDEIDTNENSHGDTTSESEEETSSLGILEEPNNAEEIPPMADESTTKTNAETKPQTSATPLELSATEEAAKLEAIQGMVQKRKEQQVELDKLEHELLRKTNLLQQRKEELLRMEEEVARAEDARKKDGDKSAEVLPRETKKKIPYYSPKEYSALTPEEKLKLKADRAALQGIQQDDSDTGDDDSSTAGESSENTVHPILGPVIADLGYKRIHVVSSGRLGTIPIWEKQRTYQYDRAKRMAAEKAEQIHLGFPGIICLHEDSRGKLSIIDGQHRVGMMQVLRENRNKLKKSRSETEAQVNDDRIWKEQETYFRNVLVEVYSESSNENSTQTTNEGHSYAEQVFLEINKAEPALIDVQGSASETERKIISEAVSTLQHLYSDMFSSSQRCRPPNANQENLCNIIIGSNLLRRHNELTSGKKLVDWLIAQNAGIGELYESDSKRQQLIAPKAWRKASKNGFYLGLESSWLYK